MQARFPFNVFLNELRIRLADTPHADMTVSELSDFNLSVRHVMKKKFFFFQSRIYLLFIVKRTKHERILLVYIKDIYTEKFGLLRWILFTKSLYFQKFVHVYSEGSRTKNEKHLSSGAYSHATFKGSKFIHTFPYSSEAIYSFGQRIITLQMKYMVSFPKGSPTQYLPN